MPPLDVILEQDSANDEDAVIVRIHQPSGAEVKQGALVLEVETSKAVQELEAPADGVVVHSLAVGATVDFGSVLFRVLPPGAAPDAAAPPQPANAQALSPALAATAIAPAISPALELVPTERLPANDGPAPGPAVVTDRARTLAAELGVNLEDIEDRFITVEHVRRHIGETPAPLAAPQVPAKTKPAKPVAGAQPLAVRKRREIRTLSRGAGATMLSVIGASVGKISRPGVENPFFEDRIVDVVAFEASRLMAAHPLLNAAYVEGDAVKLHSQINAGVAFDDGEHGLVVFSLQGSDKLSLPEIQDRFLDGLEKYVEEKLSSSEMNSATFTITDLSYFDVDFVLPLLPIDQGSIIGVTRDKDGGYKLYIGFDHRITEGRDAALFLQQLAERVRSFNGFAKPEAADQACAFCGKGVAAETGGFHGKGLLRIVDRRGRDAFCCHACFSGW